MMQLEVLASGSRGNSALIRSPGEQRCMLIDAGLSPRRIRHALQDRDHSHQDLTDVLITHSDGDHLHTGWAKAIGSWNFTLHVHHTHVARVKRSGIPSDRISAFDDVFTLGGETHVSTALAPHDVHGSVSYIVRRGDAVIGWATDLGRLSDELLAFFSDARPQVFAIESNYDREMQLMSDRPEFLIDRIMGGTGHLSNDEAIDAVLHVSKHIEPHTIVLLHRSEQCNCPQRIRALWSERASHLADRMIVASQHESMPPIMVGSHACSGATPLTNRGPHPI
jgi:phosphoribosyl 1,2-cyclic phosphodiesterase